MKLGELLALSRELKGWSLRELGRRSGLSNNLISQIETGHVVEPSFQKVVRLAHALGISLNKLTKTVDLTEGDKHDG